MTDVSPNTSTIKLTGDFTAYSPQELFDYWVRPDLLVQWWPREAVVDPKIGGDYVFTWPEQNWRLRGKYTAFDPGKHLGFTWSWDHDPAELGPSQVDLYFEPADIGSKLIVEHGPWSDSATVQEERQGIVEGWIHFGMRLAGLRDGAAS